MAAIVAHAEVGVDYYSQFNFLRYWSIEGSTHCVSAMESAMSAAAGMVVLFHQDSSAETHMQRLQDTACIVCVTETGVPSKLLSKYRPPGAVFVASTNEVVLRQANSSFATYGLKLDSTNVAAKELAALALARLKEVTRGAKIKACKVVIVSGHTGGPADVCPTVTVIKMGSGMGARQQSVGVALTTPAGTPVVQAGVKSLRSTKTSLAAINKKLTRPRCTKIICTLGPSCWSEEGMSKLLDAGCDIVRFNFSHGDHAAHQEVLDRFRKVCAAKSAQYKADHGVAAGPTWATLLDTKGPEVRTAMLRGGKPIQLTSGQSITVESVGDRYTSFEGYKTEDEGTRIGLSYPDLCQSLVPGDRILIADGTIQITVDEILSRTELRGTVANSKELGQRKNCNLPGVQVQLPVLTEADIHDVKDFACKNNMDFVAASFVQSAADVRFVRTVLDEAGGFDIKIISKIENQAGLKNFAEILQETDGVMVARGDLGQDIDSSKIPLAQKMIITMSGLAGKFVICATQMLESMIKSPRPTRAELTDVSNAILDGADACMLSGETANGDFPDVAVQTMAAICENAEQMSDEHSRYNVIRANTPSPLESAEAVCSSAVQMALDMEAKAIIVFTASGRAAGLIAKYRPPMPAYVVSPEAMVAGSCRAVFGLVSICLDFEGQSPQEVTRKVVAHVNAAGGAPLRDGDQLVVVHRRTMEMGNVLDDQRLAVRMVMVGDVDSVEIPWKAGLSGDTTVICRSTKIGLDTLLDPGKFKQIVRKSKILCTLGPKCTSMEMLGKLVDAGLNIARLNFSHGDHESHQQVLDTYRAVLANKGSTAAVLLDTKGPEIRTAMLRGGEPIKLVQGQEVIIEAVGDRYTEFEGFQNETETRIGLSYSQLCQSVKPGNKLLLSDGVISIEVVQILSDTELKGRVLNSKSLGQRKNCNLPGVKVQLPVLLDKDISDLQNFCCKNDMDFVAASFVQSKDDVLFIRKVLDDAGGHAVKIISKIENQEGLKNYDEILEVTDGIMVARGDLGMEIPVEKVALAQKMMVAKANIAGKFCIVATQMLESMIENTYPTRAEISDVANAVFDGADAVMLSGETANGVDPEQAVRVMASICLNAELGVNNNQCYNFIRSFTPKPVGTVEAVVAAMAKNAVDIRPGMLIVFSESGKTARLISKYRPCVPVLVVTSNKQLARSLSALYACYCMVLDKPMATSADIKATLKVSLQHGVKHGLCVPGKEVVVLGSTKATTSGVGKGAERELFVTVAPGQLQYEKLGSLAPNTMEADDGFVAKTISLRASHITLDLLTRESVIPKKTKIMATVGPRSSDADTIRAMVQAGMDVMRFNLAHETKDMTPILETYRAICAELNTEPCVCCDLQGSEIRSCFLIDKATKEPVDSINLKRGDTVVLYGTADHSSATFTGWSSAGDIRIGIGYADLAAAVQAGTVLRLDTGSIAFKVLEAGAAGPDVRGEVLSDCVLGSHKMVSIADADVQLPFLNPKDLTDIKWAVTNKVNYIAASFTRSRDNMLELKAFLAELDSGDAIQIIAKIEDAQGLRNLEGILEECEGAMIARGDLGLEISPEKIALAQNFCITKTNIRGKVSIIAKQMLESMVVNPRPTRAEITDVSNSAFDSADCIMLGNETAIGAFPVEAVRTAAAILRNSEEATNYYALHSFIRDFSSKPFTSVEAACASLAKASMDTPLVAVITITDRMDIAGLVTKFRPQVPHIVVSDEVSVAQSVGLYFGMTGVVCLDLSRTVEAVARGGLAKALGPAAAGAVAVLHGSNGILCDDSPAITILNLG